MIDLNYEIGLAELALVEAAGGSLLSETQVVSSGVSATTHIASAYGLSATDIAAGGGADFSLTAVATAATTSAGSSVFTPDVQTIVNSVLAAAGATVVRLISESDPIFQIAGVGSAVFAGQARTALALSASGSTVIGLSSNRALPAVLHAIAGDGSTLLGSAVIALTLDSASSGAMASSAVGLANGVTHIAATGLFSGYAVAIGNAALSFSGSSATAWDVEKLVVGAFSVAGVSTVSYAAQSASIGNLAAAGATSTNFGASVIYDELPRAWDYTIHPLETRGVQRPFEDRTARYN